MAMLDNVRWERFAQGVAAGKPASQAYTEAGYVSIGNAAEVSASRLLSNAKISARVDELVKRAPEGIVIDRQWVLEKLIANAAGAIDAGDRSVANRAYELLGKELGMFVERQIQDQNVRILSGDPIDDEAWERQYATGLGAPDRPAESAH